MEMQGIMNILIVLVAAAAAAVVVVVVVVITRTGILKPLARYRHEAFTEL